MLFIKKILTIHLIISLYIIISYLFSYMTIQDDDGFEEIASIILSLLIIPFIIIPSLERLNDSRAYPFIMSIFGVIITSLIFLFTFLLLWDIVILTQYFVSSININLARYSLLYHYIKIYCVLPLSFMLLIIAYINHFKIKITKVSVKSDRKKIKEPFSIAVIADLHLGYTRSEKTLYHWVEKINALNPNIVLIVGDIIDRQLKPLMNKDLSKVFRKIKAPGGVFGVFGNHDEIEDKDNVLAYLKESNIQFLFDENITILENITLIGRKDKGFMINNNRKNLSELLKESKGKEQLTIVMDHQPDSHYGLLSKECPDIDIILSGHTHAGQFFPFNVIGKLITGFFYGYKKYGHLHAFITNGIGNNEFFPFRLGAQSEILFIKIEQ